MMRRPGSRRWIAGATLLPAVVDSWVACLVSCRSRLLRRRYEAMVAAAVENTLAAGSCTTVERFLNQQVRRRALMVIGEARG